ncbi:growth arrest-specific protein 1 like protein [Ditylenchus destructor]|uniref:Growth arrest-specific protein 1 like protein n=1 Tax=Ditylenchus destructor TaxID=166010 RepID=A0AAD4QZZ8_9BILA|nr:growth arrest-specific protein 1 like protein [Ditylenchus destructor]
MSIIRSKATQKFLSSRRLSLFLFTVFASVSNARNQPPQPTEECMKASQKCEADTDCIHRLAVLQSACVTNTCQPQCREAALNLYQNRDGRQLLRTDATCVPGRYELEKCGFLPNKSPKHCSFAKLMCETDLQCNAKWEVFISECEAETNEGRCPEKCKRQLNATLATPLGGALADCTCTDKEDNRCIQLREISLRSCLSPSSQGPPMGMPLPRPGQGNVHTNRVDGPSSSEEITDLVAAHPDQDHAAQPDSAHSAVPD